jgi:CheY-like chemotaxis protein
MTENRKERVLIAEDEDNIREALATVLGDIFDITAVGRGDAALELLRNESFDLVLSDVRMPGLDGIALFRNVKRFKPEQKFIFLTVSSLFSDDPEARDILTREADAFLGKPYRIPALIDLINKVLGTEK